MPLGKIPSLNLLKSREQTWNKVVVCIRFSLDFCLLSHHDDAKKMIDEAHAAMPRSVTPDNDTHTHAPPTRLRLSKGATTHSVSAVINHSPSKRTRYLERVSLCVLCQLGSAVWIHVHVPLPTNPKEFYRNSQANQPSTPSLDPILPLQS